MFTLGDRVDFSSIDMSHLRLFFVRGSRILYCVVVFRALVAPLALFVAFCLMSLAVIIVTSANSHAEKTVDLYTASVLVVNRSPEVRRKAVAKGLEDVLVRLSGRASVLQSQEVQSALTKAADYLDRFSYQATNQTLTIAGASQKATLLLMQFDSLSVKRLAKRVGLPIWSENRPDTLVWAASDRRGKKYVDMGSDLAEALNLAAAERGLPIALPVLDLEDRAALPVTRLWALDEGRISSASKRYATNAVLSGRFTKNGQSWGGSFVLMHQGQNRYLSVQGKDELTVTASLIDQVSDYFLDIYAINTASNTTSSTTLPPKSSVNPSAAVDASLGVVNTRVRGPRDVFLLVNNIDDFSKYVTLMNYFETLSALDSVIIVNASRPQLLLDLRLAVDKSQFLSVLELDKRLQRVAGSSPHSNSLTQYQQSNKPLEFSWR